MIDRIEVLVFFVLLSVGALFVQLGMSRAHVFAAGDGSSFSMGNQVPCDDWDSRVTGCYGVIATWRNP